MIKDSWIQNVSAPNKVCEPIKPLVSCGIRVSSANQKSRQMPVCGGKNERMQFQQQQYLFDAYALEAGRLNATSSS